MLLYLSNTSERLVGRENRSGKWGKGQFFEHLIWTDDGSVEDEVRNQGV